MFDIQTGKEKLNQAVKELQKRLINSGVILKSLRDDNLLEELYLKVTDEQSKQKENNA